MSVLSVDLYGRIVSNGPIRVIQDDKLTLNGGDLGWNQHLCETDAVYFFKRKTSTGWYNKVRELKTFVFAGYATYIPYGNSGYQLAKEILKEKGLSIEEFRVEKFKKIMGNNLDDLSSEEFDYIKSFFIEFEKDIIDIRSPKDAAIMFCRIHNEIEANFVMTGEYNVKEAKQKMFARISDYLDDVDTPNVNTLLSEVKKPISISSEQIDFIKSFLVL